MKKTVIITSILCTGLLIVGGFKQTINAEDLKINNSTYEVIDLTQEEALNMLINNNNKVNYLYQGDEHGFNTLAEKGLIGYVFLPDVETDIGYFVNKETQEIYYFHPSGYLELVK